MRPCLRAVVFALQMLTHGETPSACFSPIVLTMIYSTPHRITSLSLCLLAVSPERTPGLWLSFYSCLSAPTRVAHWWTALRATHSGSLLMNDLIFVICRFVVVCWIFLFTSSVFAYLLFLWHTFWLCWCCPLALKNLFEHIKRTYFIVIFLLPFSQDGFLAGVECVG